MKAISSSKQNQQRPVTGARDIVCSENSSSHYPLEQTRKLPKRNRLLDNQRRLRKRLMVAGSHHDGLSENGIMTTLIGCWLIIALASYLSIGGSSTGGFSSFTLLVSGQLTQTPTTLPPTVTSLPSFRQPSGSPLAVSPGPTAISVAPAAPPTFTPTATPLPTLSPSQSLRPTRSNSPSSSNAPTWLPTVSGAPSSTTTTAPSPALTVSPLPTTVSPSSAAAPTSLPAITSSPTSPCRLSGGACAGDADCCFGFYCDENACESCSSFPTSSSKGGMSMMGRMSKGSSSTSLPPVCLDTAAPTQTTQPTRTAQPTICANKMETCGGATTSCCADLYCEAKMTGRFQCNKCSKSGKMCKTPAQCCLGGSNASFRCTMMKCA